LIRTIVKWCLGHRSVVFLGAFLLLAGGIFAASQLKRELLPPIDFPVIIVSTVAPGNDPESVARDVTEPIENAIEGLVDVTRYRSFSSDGFSTVQIEYDLDADTDEKQTELERALEGVVLPEGTQAPRINRITATGQAEVLLTIIAEKRDLSELAALVEDEVIPILRTADGVTKIELRGGAERRVEIRLDPKKLVDKGISADQINGVLRANNLSLPAGGITEGEQSVPVRVAGELSSIDELRDLVVGAEVPAAAAGAGGGGPPAVASGQVATTPAQATPANPSTADSSSTPDASASGSTADASATPDAAVTPPPAPVVTPTPESVAAPTPVLLRDVATVGLADIETGGISRTGGKPSLDLSIFKDPDSNSVTLSREVKELLPEIEELLGFDRIEYVVDNADFIQESINSLLEKAAIGSLVVLVLVLLWLRSFRATLVTAIAIPLSLLAGLLLSLWTDLSLNILTLSGLTIAVGRVIDDAIVVLENIYSHMQRGEDAETAALEGTSEVSSAIASSTLTAVAVFMPIGLVGGVISQFFLSFSLIVALSLLSSFVIAITLVPVLARTLLGKAKIFEPEKEPVVRRVYSKILGWGIRHRLITVLIGLVLFAGSLSLLPLIPTNFIDSTDTDVVIAQIELPPGTSQDETSDRVGPFEHFLEEMDEIKIATIRIGGESLFGQPGFNQAASRATTYIAFKEGADAEKLTRRIEDEGFMLYGDGFSVNQISGGPGSGSFQLLVTNKDIDALRDANEMILAALADVDDLNELESDLSDAKPEVSVKVDRAKASASGLTAFQVGSTLRLFLQGQPAGSISVDGEDTPVFMIALSDASDGIQSLRDVPVASGGKTLEDIAEVTEVNGPVSVGRSDGERAATINADIDSQDTGSVSAAAEEAVSALELPEGTGFTLAGESEDMASSFRDMGIAIGVAIVLVYLILVVFFGSLMHPVTIMLSVPLSSIGALGALLLTGRALGLPALLGLLMLIGIVVANAILLIDFVQKARARGETKKDAIMMAGRRRLRPILMTALVTVGALTPLAIGASGGVIISASLATVVIGGLLASTLLTLVVVPAVYSLLSSLKARIFRLPREQEVAKEVVEAAEPASDEPKE